MILIISQDVDMSTSKVMSYIGNQQVKRINRLSNEYTYPFELKNSPLSAYTSIWLRRGNFFKVDTRNKFWPQKKTINRLFHFLAENHPRCLGSLTKEFDHNKLIDLLIAESIGINIPSTYIITKSQQLSDLPGDKSYISKYISDSQFDTLGTLEVNLSIVKKEIASSVIFPSLLQAKIEKEFEIRSFFVDGAFYSMAKPVLQTIKVQAVQIEKQVAILLIVNPREIGKIVEVKLVLVEIMALLLINHVLKME